VLVGRACSMGQDGIDDVVGAVSCMEQWPVRAVISSGFANGKYGGGWGGVDVRK